MKVDGAIRELEGRIAYYENYRKTQIEFIQSDTFRNSISEPIEENIAFTIKHTNRIMDEYIKELTDAIDILKRVGYSRRKFYMRRKKL